MKCTFSALQEVIHNKKCSNKTTTWCLVVYFFGFFLAGQNV